MAEMIKGSQRTVLITGCSSGIGRACAVELAAKGWLVFAGVRTEKDVLSLNEVDVKNVRPVLLDITQQESIDQVVNQLQEFLGSRGLNALVNNAGILVPGPMELISSEQITRQLEVNVVGSHAITKSLLPLIREAQSDSQSTAPMHSRIVFIGSISGRITPPNYGAYSASKHALEAIADAWRQELRPWKIAVTTIQPDAVATPIWNKTSAEISSLDPGPKSNVGASYEKELRTARRTSLAQNHTGLSTEKVVSVISKALECRWPRPYYPVGLRTRAAVIASSILPTSWMDFVLKRLSN